MRRRWVKISEKNKEFYRTNFDSAAMKWSHSINMMKIVFECNSSILAVEKKGDENDSNYIYLRNFYM